VNHAQSMLQYIVKKKKKSKLPCYGCEGTLVGFENMMTIIQKNMCCGEM